MRLPGVGGPFIGSFLGILGTVNMTVLVIIFSNSILRGQYGVSNASGIV
jgi:hypothetical protein